jgi:uncharacterized protein (UPF0335 family)
MTTKEEVQKELSEIVGGHPSRNEEVRVRRCEELILLLADKIDKIYQEGFEQGYDNGKDDAQIK